MKIFVSWSGNRSRAVAELFSEWLKCVIQASEPWISTRDIDRGAIWFSEINDKLRDVSVVVISLTQENKDKPWILFETGALAKGLTSNRVCTFLIDLKPADLQDPLAQFNHTLPEKSGLWDLTRTINASIADTPLEEKILEKVFDTYWPQFEKGFAQAIKDNPIGEVIPPRSGEDILSEILDNTRSLTHKIRKLEDEVFIKKTSTTNIINDEQNVEISEETTLTKIASDTGNFMYRRLPNGKFARVQVRERVNNSTLPIDKNKN